MKPSKLQTKLQILACCGIALSFGFVGLAFAEMAAGGKKKGGTIRTPIVQKAAPEASPSPPPESLNQRLAPANGRRAVN
jgi:hypothetical protein